MADPRRDGSPPGPPPPDTLRALEEQYTDTVRDRAHRYADQRATRVRRAGWPIPTNYAEELVHDAIASIWMGTRRWDPQRTPLYFRLCSIIKDRTWHEIKRAHTRKHVVFDVAVNDSTLDGDVEASLAAGASAGDLSPVVLAALTLRVVEALRELAAASEEARLILAAWEQGFIERDEVLAVTQLTAHAYDATRQRILRLARRLPPELREAAHDLLRRVS